MEKFITLEMVRDKWCACYTAEKLSRLYDHPHTVEEVLTRTDGDWATVPAIDRLWTVLREEVLDAKTLRLFACWCARQYIAPTADKRFFSAIEVAEKYANGQVSEQELAAAGSAAESAAESAAWSAAESAAESAEREKQVTHLLSMLRGGNDD